MDDYEEIEVAFTLLPGVDLTLWLRIIAAVLVAGAAGICYLAAG
jgi:hypothetical protein